jgi:hypothetical protein
MHQFINSPTVLLPSLEIAIRVISRLIMAIFGKIAYVAYKSRVKVRVKVNISTHMIIWYDCILFELCLYGMIIWYEPSLGYVYMV